MYHVSKPELPNTMKTCSLIFLLRGDEILLAMRKRGFGTGYYNGAGGKLLAGETVEKALLRETQEEIGVTPTTYHKVAINEFVFPDGITDMYVHVFVATEWEGTPEESEEMAPRWFKQSEIPYDDMWQDDILWMPLVLRGKLLKTRFTFDDEQNMLSAQIDIVDKLQ